MANQVISAALDKSFKIQEQLRNQNQLRFQQESNLLNMQQQQIDADLSRKVRDFEIQKSVMNYANTNNFSPEQTEKLFLHFGQSPIFDINEVIKKDRAIDEEVRLAKERKVKLDEVVRLAKERKIKLVEENIRLTQEKVKSQMALTQQRTTKSLSNMAENLGLSSKGVSKKNVTPEEFESLTAIGEMEHQIDVARDNKRLIRNKIKPLARRSKELRHHILKAIDDIKVAEKELNRLSKRFKVAGDEEKRKINLRASELDSIIERNSQNIDFTRVTLEDLTSQKFELARLLEQSELNISKLQPTIADAKKNHRLFGFKNSNNTARNLIRTLGFKPLPEQTQKSKKQEIKLKSGVILRQK